MPPIKYTRELLADAAARSVTWNDLMRRLGYEPTGGRRRSVQRAASEFDIDTSHFKQRSPWRKYPDELIAKAVVSSTSIREVVSKLGAKPAAGTLSHIRRRIAAAGIDVSHFPNLNRSLLDLPFTRQELATTAASSKSIRAMARTLDIPDDSRSRAALRRCIADLGIDITHFSHTRIAIPDDRLRDAVASSTSFADVMRVLDLPLDYASHRRAQRRVDQLGLDTTHFKRSCRRVVRAVPVLPKPIADVVLRIQPQGSPRTNHQRLRRALDEIGVPFACDFCGNTGEWRGKRITLQIDHINGEWLDNRRENLRYLCPNCHATTETWCGGNRRRGRTTTA